MHRLLLAIAGGLAADEVPAAPVPVTVTQISGEPLLSLDLPPSTPVAELRALVEREAGGDYHVKLFDQAALLCDDQLLAEVADPGALCAKLVPSRDRAAELRN